MYIPCTHKLYTLNPFNHVSIHVKVVMHVPRLSTDIQWLQGRGVVWYGPFNACCVLCSPGEVLGVVDDCDLLSAETTSPTHIILIIADEMWTHITQHHNITIHNLHACIRTCTRNCIHAPHPPFSLPPPSHHTFPLYTVTHIMMLMRDCQEPLPVHAVKI